MGDLTDFKDKNTDLVFCDIDDTLTKNGRLQEAAFSAIWRLFDNGIKLVPITGRPAGWCELIARQWPVAGVIGENGGLYYHYSNSKMHRYYAFDEQQRQQNRIKLNSIAEEVLAKVAGSALASDQFCRQMDLAIDFCEDVSPLNAAAVDRIVEIFLQHGAQAKISSIHVNGWFGDYNKLSACKKFCSDVLDLNVEAHQSQMIFVGDSPNDEPMFDFFDNSFGVANVREFSKRLKAQPKYVSSSPYGEGFAEIAQRILELR